MNNRIYPYKIKPEACALMQKVLKYPDIVVDGRMNNALCRITVTSYTINAMIKEHYQKELAKDQIYQVEVYGIKDKDFIVLQSQLIDLGSEMLIIGPDGNKI